MRVMEDNYRKRMLLGQDGNALVQLVVINAVLFAILQFIAVIYSLNHIPEARFDANIFSWFYVSANLDKLSSRPWTVLSYMFSDMSVWRFIGNMFWLWGFGYILQDLMGNRKLVPIYLYGGVAAAALFMLSYSIFPGLKTEAPLASLVGANPSVMAVGVHTTVQQPDVRSFP